MVFRISSNEFRMISIRGKLSMGKKILPHTNFQYFLLSFYTCSKLRFPENRSCMTATAGSLRQKGCDCMERIFRMVQGIAKRSCLHGFLRKSLISRNEMAPSYFSREKRNDRKNKPIVQSFTFSTPFSNWVRHR